MSAKICVHVALTAPNWCPEHGHRGYTQTSLASMGIPSVMSFLENQGFSGGIGGSWSYLLCYCSSRAGYMQHLDSSQWLYCSWPIIYIHILSFASRLCFLAATEQWKMYNLPFHDRRGRIGIQLQLDMSGCKLWTVPTKTVVSLLTITVWEAGWGTSTCRHHHAISALPSHCSCYILLLRLRSGLHH